jgi:hypothetical protein
MTASENSYLLCRSNLSFQPSGLTYNIFIFHNDPYPGVNKAPTYTTQLWAPFPCGLQNVQNTEIGFVLFRNLFHSYERRQYFRNLLGDLGIT